MTESAHTECISLSLRLSVFRAFTKNCYYTRPGGVAKFGVDVTDGWKDKAKEKVSRNGRRRGRGPVDGTGGFANALSATRGQRGTG
jgi:hypothetical protein